MRRPESQRKMNVMPEKQPRDEEGHGLDGNRFGEIARLKATWKRRKSAQPATGRLPRLYTEPSTPTRRWDAEQSDASEAQSVPAGHTMPGCIFKLNAFLHSWLCVRKASRPACMEIIAVVVFVLPVCLKWLCETYWADKMCSWLRKKKMSARCSGIHTNGLLGRLKLCSNIVKYTGKHFIVSRFRVFLKRVGCYSLFTKFCASGSSSQYSGLLVASLERRNRRSRSVCNNSLQFKLSWWHHKGTKASRTFFFCSLAWETRGSRSVGFFFPFLNNG